MRKSLLALAMWVAAIPGAAPAQEYITPAAIAALVTRVAARFKGDFQAGGISGVANDLRDCYRGTAAATRADCIALDAAGKYVDDMHFKMMQSHGAQMGNYPFFENAAWIARMRTEGRAVFGSDQATNSFLSRTEKPIADAAMR